MSPFALFAERPGAGTGSRMRAPSRSDSSAEAPDWLVARMLALVSTSAVVLGLVYTVYFVQAGCAALAAYPLGCAAIAAGVGAFGRARGHNRLALELVCALLFAAFAGTTLLQDGVRSPALWWLATLPLILLLAGSTRVGAMLCVLFLAHVALLVQRGGGSVASWSMLVGDGSRHLALSMALSTAFVGAFAALSAHWSRCLRRTLEAARAAALAASAAKARFVAQVSHEIRTPLQGMVGATELLRDPALPETRRVGLAAAQQRSAEVLMALVNDVLDFSKLDAGRMTLESRPVDLVALLGEIESLFVPQTAAKGLSLGWSRSPEVPRVLLGDALRLRQIVANLVANAVRFTPQGGVHVHLGLDRDSATRTEGSDASRALCRVRIEVADSGVGIEPERLATLFRPFHQVDDSICRRFGGTGLGLSIADELARLMQGRIEVASTPGEGSTFTLVVPLPLPDGLGPTTPAAWTRLVVDETTRRVASDAQPDALAATETATADAPLPLAGRRVLVIEDDATNRLVVEAMLERLGAGPVLAADADEARSRVAVAPVDAVLLDLHLDGADGLCALHGLQAGGSAPSAVVAMTGSTDVADAAACRAAGVHAVLVKPFTLAQLEAVLCRACDAGAR